MSVNVTQDNFEAEVLSADTPVLVDFWAPWCGPCKAISPIVEALAEEHAGKMKVAKINVDDDGAIAAEYGVRGIPTLVLFQDGEIKGSMVGAATKEKIDAFIDQHID
jgi:thioredoxin 1